jgi:hypothetical protein
MRLLPSTSLLLIKLSIMRRLLRERSRCDSCVGRKFRNLFRNLSFGEEVRERLCVNRQSGSFLDRAFSETTLLIGRIRGEAFSSSMKIWTMLSGLSTISAFTHLSPSKQLYAVPVRGCTLASGPWFLTHRRLFLAASDTPTLSSKADYMAYGSTNNGIFGCSLTCDRSSPGNFTLSMPSR